MESPNRDSLAAYATTLVASKSVYCDHDFNCRGGFTLESVRQLAENIESVGRLLSPIWVQPACDVQGLSGYEYRVLAGHRRFIATTNLLHWETVPVTVFTGLTPHQASMINFMENLEREDLNPLQEAQAIRRLFEEGTSLNQICKVLKRGEQWVRPRLLLLKTPQEVQAMVASGRLAIGSIREVTQAKSPSEQVQKASDIVAERWSRKSANKTKPGKRPSKTSAFKKLEYMMSLGITGLPCRILAWAYGRVSDREINREIDEFLETKSGSQS